MEYHYQNTSFTMKYFPLKYFFAAPLIALVFLVSAPAAHALSCLSLDMYLDAVVKEEGGETLVFLGTATEVTKDHTQVVTVTDAKKGWVMQKMWVTHPYSNDWQYYCSNGPAKAGTPTLFLTTINEYGSFNVVQTLDPNSTEAKTFLKKLTDENVDAGITEATSAERKATVLESIKTLIAALGELIKEYAYWSSVK